MSRKKWLKVNQLRFGSRWEKERNALIDFPIPCVDLWENWGFVERAPGSSIFCVRVFKSSMWKRKEEKLFPVAFKKSIFCMFIYLKESSKFRLLISKDASRIGWHLHAKVATFESSLSWRPETKSDMNFYFLWKTRWARRMKNNENESTTTKTTQKFH